MKEKEDEEENNKSQSSAFSSRSHAITQNSPTCLGRIQQETMAPTQRKRETRTFYSFYVDLFVKRQL